MDKQKRCTCGSYIKGDEVMCLGCKIDMIKLEECYEAYYEMIGKESKDEHD